MATRVFSGYFGIQKRVAFISGEYVGYTGVLYGEIQKRYRKSPDVFRIQIDGFPKSGGWSGQVTSEARFLDDIID